MKSYLILFYSKTGNSKFIAGKLSQELVCDSKEITPLFNNLLILYFFSLIRINIPTNISTADIRKYNDIIIIGPIWGGLLISPLRTLIKKSVKTSVFPIAIGTRFLSVLDSHLDPYFLRLQTIRYY
jgi:flavodoxin